MLVFISYPRNFENMALTLRTELINRNIDTFIDTEDLNHSDVWKPEIENNISQSSVIIILYDHTAYKDQSRYFSTELDCIKNAIYKNKIKNKKLITVYFPPTEPKDLPHFLRSYNLLKAEVNSEIDNGSDDKWISTITREIESLKRYRLYKIALSIIILICITIFVIIFIDTKPNFKNFSWPWSDISYKKCESLIGEYHQKPDLEYTYIDEDRIKAMSSIGNWKAEKCTQYDGFTLLEGTETITHELSIEVNGKYEHIANPFFSFESSISIDKDGHSKKRTLSFKQNTVITPNFNKTYYKLNKSDKELIDNKYKSYESIARAKLTDANDNLTCIPLIDKVTITDEQKTLIASVCPTYVRVMVSKHPSKL